MIGWLPVLLFIYSIYLYLPVLARGLACRRQAVCQAMGGILVYFFLYLGLYLLRFASEDEGSVSVLVVRREKKKSCWWLEVVNHWKTLSMPLGWLAYTMPWEEDAGEKGDA